MSRFFEAQWRVSILIVTTDFRCLRSIGATVRAFATPIVIGSRADAYRILDNINFLYATIIDARLPDGSGYDLAEVARSKAYKLPIILP